MGFWEQEGAKGHEANSLMFSLHSVLLLGLLPKDQDLSWFRCGSVVFQLLQGVLVGSSGVVGGLLLVKHKT